MRWEYRVATTQLNDVAELQQTLATLGQDGWELVTVLGGAGFSNMLIVLKRPLSN